MINDAGKSIPALNPVMIFLAEYTPYILALSMLVYWFLRRRQDRMMIIQSICAFVLATSVGKVCGLFYAHYQPFAVLPDVNKLVEHELDNSFPSNHTILFFSISFSIWLVHKMEGLLWLLLACLVAQSRVWIGVHYPIDIATGAIISIVAALIMCWLIPRLPFIRQGLTLYEKVEQRVLPVKNRPPEQRIR